MEISNNYWDFVEDIIATPVTILKEQADFLTKTTKGTLVGEISFEKDLVEDSTPRLYQPNKFEPNVALNIKSPILDYTYQLLSVKYNVKDNYPVYIMFDGTKYTATKEEEFRSHIQTILRSEVSKKIIQNLYSQSKAFEKTYKTDGLDV